VAGDNIATIPNLTPSNYNILYTITKGTEKKYFREIARIHQNLTSTHTLTGLSDELFSAGREVGITITGPTVPDYIIGIEPGGANANASLISGPNGNMMSVSVAAGGVVELAVDNTKETTPSALSSIEWFYGDTSLDTGTTMTFTAGTAPFVLSSSSAAIDHIIAVEYEAGGEVYVGNFYIRILP
jgi:hypothetical protein